MGGDHALAVAGQRTEVVGEHLTVRVGGDKAETVAGSSRETVDGERALAGGSVSLDVEGSRCAPRSLATTKSTLLAPGGSAPERSSRSSAAEATIIANKDRTVTVSGKNVTVKVAGRIEVEGDKLSIKSHGAVNVSTGVTVKVRGRGINFN